MSETLTGSPGQLLKPIEAATVLHCSVASIYRWTSSGRLPALRLGTDRGRLRIPAVAVEGLLEQELLERAARLRVDWIALEHDEAEMPYAVSG
jgi:excisionase family DNA binding protein